MSHCLADRLDGKISDTVCRQVHFPQFPLRILKSFKKLNNFQFYVLKCESFKVTDFSVAEMVGYFKRNTCK